MNFKDKYDYFHFKLNHIMNIYTFVKLALCQSKKIFYFLDTDKSLCV